MHDDQVDHRGYWCRSVPVIDIRWTPDGLALIELDDLAVTGSGQGNAVGHDHVLACRVQVPCGADPCLKGDIGTGVVGGIVAGKWLSDRPGDRLA